MRELKMTSADQEGFDIGEIGKFFDPGKRHARRGAEDSA